MQEGKMNTIQLILRALSMVPDYYQSHKISCWIILGINLLGVIAGIRKTFLLSRALRGLSAFLYIVLRVLLIFGSLSFGLMLLLASEVAKASPEQFSFGFYIEIIAAGIILLVLLARELEGDDTDTANSILVTLFVVILSVIFMIFGNGMIRWGFSLFGKRVGACFFGVYAGWVADVAAGTKAAITAVDWIGLILISFVLPAVLTPLIAMPLRKAGWIKDGDMKLQ